MGRDEPALSTRPALPGRWEALGRRAPQPAAGRGADGAPPDEGGPDGEDPPARQSAWRFAAGLLAAVAVALWLSAMAWNDRPTTSAPIVLPVALALGWAVAARAGRTTTAFDLVGVLAAGWSLRLVGAWFRYRDAADALEYHEEGMRLADSFRSFDFAVDAGRPVPGTGTLRLASGAIHALTFDDLAASFAVMTLAAFVGCVLLVRAVQVALPEADLHRYALALMVWPSLWFWPSSLGKEAWMLLSLGLISLGVAHVLVHRAARAVGPLVAGLVMVGFVRPHVGMLAMAALGVAVLLAAPRAEGRRWTARILVAVLLLVGGAVMAEATADRLQLDNLGTASLGQALEGTSDQTGTGDAQFSPVDPTNPLALPMAVVTVLFRPFPHEVDDVVGLASSIEGVALAVWLAASAPRLRAAVRSARRLPYLLYAGAFSLMFCYAFASIANFGILVRQRSQVLPFVLVLVALPAAAGLRQERARRRASVLDDAGPP